MSVAWRVFLFCLGVATTLAARGDGFVRNVGQVRDGSGAARNDVRYIHHGIGRSVVLRERGFSYQYSSIVPEEGLEATTDHRWETHRIDIDFVGTSGKIVIDDRTSLYQEVHYTSAEQVVVAGSADEVLYRNAFDGVDIRFHLSGGEFKYDILCRDHNALDRVRFRYSGSDGPVVVDAAGSIVLRTRFGVMEERIPESYFRRYTQREPVSVLPALLDAEGEVGFRLLGPWPDGSSLVIDPMPHRLWSTYLGGSGYDDVTEVEIGADGGVLVAGHTDSDENIATTGAYQQELNGIQNTFLVAYDSDGLKLFGTYFGGTLADRCYGLLRDPLSGAIYMAGGTFSSGMATAGAHQIALASLDDALLLKFDASGILQWSTYYGGNDHDLFTAIALDGQGDLVLTGHTKSMTGIATDMTVLPGTENIFVAKFSADGALVWGTYLGGSFDSGWAIDVDAGDNVLVAGGTASVIGIATPGAHQEVLAGGSDAFIAKYAPDGALQWSTYFGGTGNDIINGLVISSDGTMVVAGTTESTNGIVTPGAGQATPGSIDDGFLARFSAEGVQLWGTYIGGEQLEHLTSLEQLADGRLIVAGWGQSNTMVTLPNAFQPLPAGEFDALVMSFNAAGGFLWGTYYGGLLSEYLNDIAIDPNTGHVLVVGNTRSATGIAVPGAQDPQPLGGLYDGFLARFCVPPSPAINATDGSLVCGPGTLQCVLDAEFPSIQWNIGGSGQSVEFTSLGTGQFEVYANVVDHTGCPGVSDTLIITVVDAFQPEITITVEPEPTVCLGAPLQLGVTPAFASYRWWNGDTDMSTVVQLSDTNAHWLQVTVFNAEGCSASDSVRVQALDCSGISDPTISSPATIMPNPSSGFIRVDLPGRRGETITGTLYTPDGSLVERLDLVLGDPFPLSVPSGVYVLILGAPGTSAYQRAVLVVVRS